MGAPVLDSQERVYVAALDGTLHAFERDGRFRFSYTLEGTPLGGASLRTDDGVILVGTSARWVYAINQSGRLHWSFRTLAPVWSGMHALNRSTVAFLGQDHRLYALTSTGKARYRVRAPSAPTTPPVVAPKDVVWVGLADGVARFQAAFTLDRIPLEDELGVGPVEQIVPWGDRAVVRKAGRAWLVTPAGAVTNLGSARMLGGDGEAVALHDGRRLRWAGQGGVAPQVEGGTWRQSEAVDQLPAGPLTVVGDRVWVPTQSGELLLWDSGEEAVRVLALGEVALRRVSVGVSGSFVVTSDEVGRFCAVRLDESH